MNYFKKSNQPIHKTLLICFLSIHLMVAPIYDVILNLLIQHQQKEISFFSNYVFADDFLNSATQGQDFGKELLKQPIMPNVNDDTAKIRTKKNEKGEWETEDFNVHQFFNLKKKANTETLQNMLNDGSLREEVINKTDSERNSTTNSGKAHQTITDSINLQLKPNLTNDPIWNMGDKTLSDIENSGVFQDCKETTVPIGEPETRHLPDIKTCSTVVDPNLKCGITRTVTKAQIEVKSTGTNICSGIEGIDWNNPATFVDIGSLFLEEHGFRHLIKVQCTGLSSPDGKTRLRFYGTNDMGGIIKKLDFSYLSYVATPSNNQPEREKIRTTSTDTYHFQQRKISDFYHDEWEMFLFGASNLSDNGFHHGDYQVVFVMDDCPNGSCGLSLLLRVKWGLSKDRLTVYTPYISIGKITRNIKKPKPKILEEYLTERPPNCSTNPECKITGFQCDLYDNNRKINDVIVSNTEFGDVMKPLFPGDNPQDNICWEAHSMIECDSVFTGKTVCTDSNDSSTCFTYEELKQGYSCDILEKDNQCAFLSSKCVDGMIEPITGQCVLFESTYDCGIDVITSTPPTETSYTCPGEIRCMGTECVNKVKNSSNEDFGKATLMLQAVEQMNEDSDCGLNNCEIFTGEAYFCTKAFGSKVNCCDQIIPGVSLVDYLHLYKAISSLDKKMQLSAKLLETEFAQGVINPLSSASEGMANAAEWTWEEMQRPFTNALKDLVEQLGQDIAKDETTKAGAETAIDQGFTNITTQIAGWTGDILGDAVRDAIFTEVKNEAGEMTGEMIVGGEGAWLGELLGTIMYIYMMYQIATIFFDIFNKCNDDELEFMIKRQLKSCHIIGEKCTNEFLGKCLAKEQSSCCYASPFARIFQEQVHLLLGREWEDPKKAGCPGFQVNEISDIDWDKIDLKEWLGLLNLAGIIELDPNKMSTRYSIDRTTSATNPDGTKVQGSRNTEERIDNLFKDANPDGLREHLSDEYFKDRTKTPPP